WKTGQGLREPPRGTPTGRGYALTPDGQAVAESDDAGTIHLWDAATGRELRRFEPSRPSPEMAIWVNAVAVSPDGRVLAAQGGARPEEGVDHVNRRYVWLWDVATAKLLHRLDDLADAGPIRGGG